MSDIQQAVRDKYGRNEKRPNRSSNYVKFEDSEVTDASTCPEACRLGRP